MRKRSWCLRILEREDSERAEQLVQPRAVVRSARVAAAVVLERRGARRDRDLAFLSLRVGEHRTDDRRPLEDVEGQLAGVLVLEVADRVLLPERILVGQIELGVDLVDLDAVIRAEEPDLVLQDEPAEVGAELLADVLGEGAVQELRVAGLGEVRGRVVDDLAVLEVRAHARVVVVAEHAAVELVAARLRDDVDDAARVAAVLGLVAARLHFDFLDELVVDVLALEALDDVRRVDAVDQEQVLRRGRPVDRDRQRTALRLAEVRLHARLREHDLGVVAADRELVDDLGAVVAALGRRRHVDQRRLARDRHFGRGRELELEADRRRRVEADGGLLLDLTEPREVARHGVRARAERSGSGSGRPRQSPRCAYPAGWDS